jgi:DNA modification methylase
MGSGTTAVAALECNRKYIGFEIISEYVNIANDRIMKLGLKDTDGLW